MNDADNSITNEIQDLNLTANTLTITDNVAASNIDLSPYLDNTDNQALSKSGNTVTLEDGGSVSISASAPASAGQVLKWNGTEWEAGTDEVNDADNSITNEIQDLNLTANTLTITNKASPTSINLSPYQQTISKSGNSISLTNGGSFNISNSSPINGQVLSWNGSSWVSVTDGDTDNANELQTLSFASPTLSITGGNSVDLSAVGLLPTQTGNSGKYLTTNGNVASWNALGSLASANEVTSSQILMDAVDETHINTSVAGNGLTGGGGSPLSIDLAAASGLDVSSGKLALEDIVVGTSYTIIAGNNIVYDNKGRITSIGTSDERLKKDILKLDSVLSKLLKVNGYTYQWKDSENQTLQYGVIAQQLETIFPQLVINNPNGVKNVNYQGLIPILIEALKEEHQRVTGLENELGLLKAQMALGEERMKSMEAKLDLLLRSVTAAKTTTEQ